MAEPPKTDRNPIIVPIREASGKRVCPKCGSDNFIGLVAHGAPRFTCQVKECRNVWSGGNIHQAPPPGAPPYPPDRTKQPLRFDTDIKNPNTGQPFIEVRERQSTVPDFKGGARIPDDEEI